MRVVAGAVLFCVTVLTAGVLASRAGRADDGRVPTDPDLPIRTGRYDEGLLARMAYEPPAVMASARTLSLPDIKFGSLPEMRLSLNDAAEVPASLAIAPIPAARRSIDDAAGEVRQFLVRIGPKAQDRKKGRWFVFAAGSGDAFGLNLIRDPEKGLRRAGWSVEKLAEFGKAQVGVGWRRGPTQVSLAASRREIGAYGISQEDTVVGVTVSVKP